MSNTPDYLKNVETTDFTDFKRHVWEMTDKEYYDFYDETFRRLGFFDYTATNIQFFRQWIHGTVLDAGCNGGGFLQALRDEGYPKRLVGVDISKVALDEAANRGLEVYWGDLEDRLFFPDRYFNTVVCGHTLEHLRKPEKAFNELKRVSRDSIIILIPLQGEEARWKKTNTHIQFWPTVQSFEAWAGMRVAESMVKRDGTLAIMLFKVGM